MSFLLYDYKKQMCNFRLQHDQLDFMQRFGYLADTGQLEIGALYSESAVTEAIKSVQRFGALSETGVLDEETTKVRAVKGSSSDCEGALFNDSGTCTCTFQLMTSPRCGVPDILRLEQSPLMKENSRPSVYHKKRRRRRRKKIHQRQRRFVVGGRAWIKRRITYL